jgi:hypothetical protein
MPLNFFPAAVITITFLSDSAATSLKNFLCATDNHLSPILPNEIAKQLFKNHGYGNIAGRARRKTET